MSRRDTDFQPGWRFPRAFLDQLDREFYLSKARGFRGTKSDFAQALLMVGMEHLAAVSKHLDAA